MALGPMAAGTEPAGLVSADVYSRSERAASNLAVADQGSHPRLDRVTRLARRFFDVPMAAVTVFDGTRAWFPSADGVELDVLPRDETLCDMVSQEDRTIVVTDAREDSRFERLTSVRDGMIAFYAGRPLRDAAGNVLGALCLASGEPHQLSAHEQEALEEFGQLAEQELLASAEEAAIHDLQSILQPEGRQRIGAWTIDGVCVPALNVGGDFYDYFVDEDAIMLGLGDVMGKGTPAALLGASVRGMLRSSLARQAEFAHLGAALGSVGRVLQHDLERAGSFITVFGVVIDPATGHVRYVDAGSGLCLVRRSDGTVQQLMGEGRPLGVLPGDAWVEHETVLEPGDRLMVFSDGLLDLLEDQAAWRQPLGELLAGHGDPTELVQTVRRLTEARTGADDVTVVAIYRDPAR